MDTIIVKENELLQSVIQGRLEFFRSCSVFSPLPGAAFQINNDGSFYYSSGIDYAPCNGVMENNESVPSEKEIENAIEFFKIRKLPFIWWTSSKNLEKKEFQFGGILTGIALDISDKLPIQSTSSHVKIKIISENEDLSAFAIMAVDVFGMNPSVLEQFQAINTVVMNNGKQIHFLALLDNIPVGTATLSTSDSSAGIWNLATLPEYRKCGVGTALVSAALAEAKRLNYEQMIAILMPKGLAWGLFTKLGFKEVCQFPFYVYGMSAEELEK